ncbi:prolyl hydroxylase family protein [Pacificimonas flava]|uniref:Eukaryotic Peptidyl prolyl 4-hydroxylase, alpha subunit n=1 Tax=Pacificimonas flava TaxID=1234595 RepID=M2U555_9SPHN|nr:2OG-Fe(II) oxygenase [Pacificimonas flava]EMD83167.1 eukaryotic Peptidyl prolyl 4-hydroxylase, alpha subunit [Pacificimonas flava]MBB5279268.1 prolyl 4-hydroxylase [Pacificimonas flava]
MTVYQPKTPFSKQRSTARARIGEQVWDRLKSVPGLKIVEEERARIALVDNYLDDLTCQELCWRIDAENQRSEAYTEGGIDERRTSYSCNFDRWEPFVERIDSGIADLLGLRHEQGETMQGQRYEPGQFFRPHPDFFLIDEPHWDGVLASGGQRTWTAMVFLDAPLSGGATRFVELGMEIRPKPGRLLVWNNMAPDGAPNPNTFHEGSDVVMGRKHIITKWFRENDWI